MFCHLTSFICGISVQGVGWASCASRILQETWQCGSGVGRDNNILSVLNSYFHSSREIVPSSIYRRRNVCIVPGERDGGDGYHGQGESAGGPRHAGHHLQLPGPSVYEECQTCVNVSKKLKSTILMTIDY